MSTTMKLQHLATRQCGTKSAARQRNYIGASPMRYPIAPFEGQCIRFTSTLRDIPRRSAPLIKVQAGSNNQAPQEEEQAGLGSIVGSIGLFVIYGAVLTYAFAFAPNQTPLRDQYFLEKLIGLGVNDGVPLNAVFTQLFFLMGIWPMIYCALLIPGGKSGNKIPAWPFISASFGLGAFALIPYFALWQEPQQTPTLPPTKEETEGLGNLMLKGMESPVLAVLLWAGSAYCLYQAATAGVPSWNAYIKLLQESRFVHVTSLDFLMCTGFSSFWMYNDAQLRNWGPRDIAVPILGLLPVIGPATYLVLRPKAPSS